MRCSLRHCRQVYQTFNPGMARQEIERKAKKEQRRNLNMVKREAVRYETTSGNLAVAVVKKPEMNATSSTTTAPQVERREVRQDDDDDDEGPARPTASTWLAWAAAALAAAVSIGNLAFVTLTVGV